MKNKKDIYVIMEEGEEDYGQFCILDEEPVKVERKHKSKPIANNEPKKTTYGLFEKTLYFVSVVAIFILIVRNV